MRKYLVSKSLWNDDMEAKMRRTSRGSIDRRCVEKAEQFKPDPKSMFKNVYSYMPEILKEEMDDGCRVNFYA